VGGVDEDRVGQGQQLVVERVVQHSRHGLGGEAARADEVGPAHVADEQGVPGEHHAGLVGDRGVDDQDRHALRGVARCLQESQDHGAEPDLVAFPDGTVGERDVGLLAEDHGCPRALRQLAVSAHEVGVKVGLDHPADAEPSPVRFRDVLVDVTPRVHHRGLALGADQVGGVGQAAQVELLELHRRQDTSDGLG
jgi:hypothetical protein